MAKGTDVRVDWYRVILEITRGGVSTREVARRLSRSHSTVLQWQFGSTPKHHDGEGLVVLWCTATSNGRESVPLVGQNPERRQTPRSTETTA